MSGASSSVGSALQAVIHLKPKLFQLDCALPLIYELCDQQLIRDPIFVASDSRSYSEIKKNVVLFDAIGLIGGKLITASKFRNRWLNQLWNFAVLARYYLLVPLVCFQTSTRHGPIVRLLSRINRRVWGGRIIALHLDNVSNEIRERMSLFAAATVHADAKDRGRKLDTTKTISGADVAVLHSLPRGRMSPHGVTIAKDIPILAVGNTRALKTWQDFIANGTPRYLGDKVSDVYFLFVLGLLDLPNPDRNNQHDDEAVRRCLQALSGFCNRVQTVFKPHPVTDRGRLDAMLTEVGYRNYTYSYAHPMMLARNARFAIANYSSTVLCDAKAVGCPTIDFVSYDTRAQHLVGNESLLSDYVDYYIPGDEPELVRVVDRLLTEPAPKNQASEAQLCALKSEEIRTAFSTVLTP